MRNAQLFYPVQLREYKLGRRPTVVVWFREHDLEHALHLFDFFPTAVLKKLCNPVVVGVAK